MARQMRAASQANQSKQELWADLDTSACIGWLQAAACTDLIHGHTHRPGEHSLARGLGRHVLSDWDFEADPPRGDVLRLRRAGLRRIDLT